MSINIVIANIVSLLAATLMLCSGLVKDAKKTIVVQSVEMFFFILSNVLVLSIPGIISNILGIVRNHLCTKNKLSWTNRIVLVVASIILGMLVNNIGLIGWLPILTSIVFAIFMDTNDTRMKVITMLTCIMWAVHDIYVGLYVSFAFDVFTALFSLVTIVRLQYAKNTQKETMLYGKDVAVC